MKVPRGKSDGPRVARHSLAAALVTDPARSGADPAAEGDGSATPDASAPVGGPLSPDQEAELFRSIAVGFPVVAVAVDLDGLVVWANPRAEQMFGWPPGALVGRSCDVLLTEEGHEEFVSAHRSVLSGQDAEPFVTHGRRRSGEVFDASVAIDVRRDRAGRVLGTQAVLEDVTEERHVQRELAETMRRFRARFERSATPQSLIDLEGRFIAVNDATCRLMGRSREELVGADVNALSFPDDPQLIADQLERLLEGGQSAAVYPSVVAGPNGTRVPVLVDVTVVHDEDGSPTEFATFATDLTELREVQERLELQAAFFEGLDRASTDAALVFDEDRRLRHLSPAFTRMLGLRREDVPDVVGVEFAHPDDVEAIEEQVARAMAEPDIEVPLLHRLRDAEGAWHWVDSRVSNRLADPAIRGVVVNLRDVTSEVETAAALRESEMRYRVIAQTAQEGIIAVSPEGEVLFANERLGEIVGKPLAQIYADGGSGWTSAASAAVFADNLAARDTAEPRRFDITYERPDGGKRILLLSVNALVSDDGSPLGTLAMVSDVTSQRNAEQNLRQQALHDVLTGLPNRVLLMDRLGTAAARHDRSPGAGVALLFVDVDRFKEVNDRHGHAAGDRVLSEVATRLCTAVRAADTVSRIGGDEFAVICEDIAPEEAAQVARRIQQAMRAPVPVGREQVTVTLSIGLALAPPSGVHELLSHADTAMYQAKSQGRDRVRTFTAQLRGDSERQSAIAEHLRDSLAEQNVTLVYRPIVDLATRRLLGLEARLRWLHPAVPSVRREELVEAADAMAMNFELDRAAIITAARDMVQLRESGVVPPDAFVSVRVWEERPRDEDVRTLLEEVADTGLPPECLAVEIPEAFLIGDTDGAARALLLANQRGVRVFVGDFGSAYTRMQSIQQLSLNALKINRHLVHGVRGADAKAVAGAIIRVAEVLGIRTLGEGVDSEEQAQVLRELGCSAGDGHLWGQPVPVEEVAELLHRLPE